MTKTYKKRKTIVNKKRKTIVNKKMKKGAGYRELAKHHLSTLYSTYKVPDDIVKEIETKTNLENLDQDIYIRNFLNKNGLTMSEQNINKYVKKSKKHIDLYLNYLKSANEIKKRKEKAREKIAQFKKDIISKREKLQKIQPQRVTRSQKSKNINPNKEIEQLENEIRQLETKISTLEIRIEQNFRYIPSTQDDYI